MVDSEGNIFYKDREKIQFCQKAKEIDSRKWQNRSYCF